MLYSMVQISVTPKAHCLFTHCIEWCNEYKERLGAHSEQSGETLHSDFLTTWARYKRSETHPEYENQLLKCIVSYNSFHV